MPKFWIRYLNVLCFFSGAPHSLPWTYINAHPSGKRWSPTPTLPVSLRAGYSYVYMDDQWWQKLSPQDQAAYDQPCVKLVAEKKLAGSQDRRLFNVQACQP